VHAPFTLRRAELTDVQTLIDLRIAYLRELEGFGENVDLHTLSQATRRYFIRKMPSGDYIAWVALAKPTASPELRGRLQSKVIGTAGMFMVDRPPGTTTSHAREARLINVFVQDGWRGRGVANALIAACIETARRADVGRILVDDTPRGRAIYERAGFTIVNSIMELDTEENASR
jgi:GNAT superfamily N-acetyltransferase